MSIFADITAPLPVARKPLWPIYLGWLCYVVSMFLPAIGDLQGSDFVSNLDGWTCAWGALWLCWFHPICFFCTVANGIMIASPFFFARALSGKTIRMEFRCAICACCIALSVPFVLDALLLGYYLWLSSFLCVAGGLFILLRSSAHLGHNGET